MRQIFSALLVFSLFLPAYARSEEVAPVSSAAPAVAPAKDCEKWYVRLRKWAKEEVHSMKKAPPVNREELAAFRRRRFDSFLSPELQEKIAANAGKGEAIVFTEEELKQIHDTCADQLEAYYVKAIANDPHRLAWDELFERAKNSPDNPLLKLKNLNKANAAEQQALLTDSLSAKILDYDEAAGIPGGVLTNGEWDHLNKEKTLPSTFILKDMAEVIKKNYGKMMMSGGLATGVAFVAKPLITQWHTSTGAVSEVGDVEFQRALADKNARTFSALAQRLVSTDQKAVARQEMEQLFGKMTDAQFDGLVTSGIDQMMRTHFFEGGTNILLMREAREQRQMLVDMVGGFIGSVEGAKLEIARIARAQATMDFAGETDKEVLSGLADAKAAVKSQMDNLKLQIEYALIDRAYGFGKDNKAAVNPVLLDAFHKAVDPKQMDVELIYKTHYLEKKHDLEVAAHKAKN
jgi:hypothetical protein